MTLRRRAAALAAAAALALAPGCEERVKPAVAPGALTVDEPSQESWNATITFTDSGRVSGILRAGHIAAHAARRMTDLDSGITVDFYDDHQRHSSVLTARRGTVNDLTHDFEAHDSVVVVSDSGGTLRTQELYWNNASRQIHTPAFVDIVSPTERIQGQGFASDQSLKHYTVFHVTGQAAPHE